METGYVLIRTTTLIDDAMITQFGIKCTDSKKLVSEISSDRNFVQNILDKLEKYVVEPCHLLDIVEDELVERFSF